MSSGSKKGTWVYYPFLLKSPGKRIPFRFLNWVPTERNTRLQGIFTSLLIYLLLFLSESPVRGAWKHGAPSMFPNRVPTDRDTLSPEPLAKRGDSIRSFIHSCMSARVPKRSRPTYIQEKHVTVHGAPPSGRKAYIQWGAAWFPKE
jgi:hypothetical protein